MDENIGSKVSVWIPGIRVIERVLHEDFEGLYVNYKNKTVRVKPHLNRTVDIRSKAYVALERIK